MPYGNTQGIVTPYGAYNANAIPFDVQWMAINYFPLRTPLMYRLTKRPLGAPTFYMNNDTFRPRTDVLTGAYTSGDVAVTVADTTFYDVGDVLLIGSESIRVTAIANATTLTTVGAQEGTTQANHANNAAITLVTNARTGAEIDQNAISRIPSTVAQYAQTVQHAYQVGGSAQANTNYLGGKISPLDRDRLFAVQHTMDDFEVAMYRGLGSVLASGATSRPTMKGLKTLLATNSTTSPTNASAYKPSDLTRDTFQKCINNGGRPNLLLVSTDFLTGLGTWSQTLQRFDGGVSELGVGIESYRLSFLGAVEVVPAPLLGTGTAIAVNTDELGVALKRRLDIFPRGRRGDAEEGDVIVEGALDVENEAHQAWVSGVTGFAVQS